MEERSGKERERVVSEGAVIGALLQRRPSRASLD